MTTGTITFNIENPDIGLTGEGQYDISQVFKSLFTENPTFKDQVSDKIAEVIKGVKKSDIIADWTTKLKDAFVVDEANINLKKIVEEKVKDVLKTNTISDTATKSDTKTTTTKPDLLSKTIISSFKNFDVKITDFLKKVEKSNKQQPETTSPDSVFKQQNEVIVSNFTDEALKKLDKTLGTKTKDIEPKKEDKGLPDGWLKNLAMGAVALLGGGLATVISGFFDSGPFKGLKKILGTLAIKLGARMTGFITEYASKTFGALFKTVGENISNVFTKIFPKMAETLGKIVPTFVENVGKIFSTVGETIGKIGGKLGGNLLKTGASMIGKFLKPILRRIPIIGSIISFAYAYSRFKEGDLVGGILDIASGLATLVPGIGTVLSIGIDVFSAFRDVKTTPDQKKSQNIDLKQFWAKIYKNARNWPIIGSVIKIGEGIGILANNIKDKKGWALIANALNIVGFTTGISLFDEEETDEKTGVKKSNKGLLSILGDYFKSVLKKLPKSIKWLVEKSFGINLDAEEPTNEEMPKDSTPEKKQSMWQKLFKKTPEKKEIDTITPTATPSVQSHIQDKKAEIATPVYSKPNQTPQLRKQTELAIPIKPSISTQANQRKDKLIAQEKSLRNEAKKLGIDDSKVSGVYKEGKLVSIISNNKTYNINNTEQQSDNPTPIKVQDAVIDFGKFKVKPDKQDKITHTDNGAILAKSGGVLEKQLKELITEVKTLKNALTEVIVNMNKNVNENLTILCNTSDKQLKTLPSLAPQQNVSINKAPSSSSVDRIFEYRKKVYEYGRI